MCHSLPCLQQGRAWEVFHAPRRARLPPPDLPLHVRGSSSDQCPRRPRPPPCLAFSSSSLVGAGGTSPGLSGLTLLPGLSRNWPSVTTRWPSVRPLAIITALSPTSCATCTGCILTVLSFCSR